MLGMQVHRCLQALVYFGWEALTGASFTSALQITLDKSFCRMPILKMQRSRVCSRPWAPFWGSQRIRLSQVRAPGLRAQVVTTSQLISLLIKKNAVKGYSDSSRLKKKIIQYFLGKSPIILFDILKMKCYSYIFQQEGLESRFAQTQAFYI